MLELKNITKEYVTLGETVEALKGVDLQFRESEFVSVLGPSGCGKTTMLNIIGGLDQYTEGDLVINGTSTKDYKDRDWDAYRNNSIGFVFQNYNLIPHQSVLQNVEIALALCGISKSERKRRAKEALEKVGLGNQLRKKPSQMSGGQMQRVAIARAIVNDPDIILADEPTGALDTETSVQVMDILKDIAKDRLVIMVTHNPDLAEKYSTRIIKMLDGVITDDSNPLTKEEADKERLAAQERTEQKKQGKRKKLPSMSFATSFGLSLKNLISKKGRTTLTAFAGSIGIIGIALIYAVSNGMTTYINTVQEETLSSYPLTLEAQHTDLGSLMQSFMGAAMSATEHENDAVYQKPMAYDLVNAINSMDTKENDLRAFKEYLEQERYAEDSKLADALTGIQYTYSVTPLIYTKNVDGSIIKSDAQALMQELLVEYFGMNISALFSSDDSSSSMSGLSALSSMSGMSMGMNIWQEILPGDNGKLINPVVEKQYELIYGSWPNSYDEIVLVVDEHNEIDDMTLYSLGLSSKEEMDAIMEAVLNQTEVEPNIHKWSYEEICSNEFKVILNSDCYTKDESTGLYTDLRDTAAGLKYLYDNGLTLKVSGIIRPQEDALASVISGSIGYTSALTEYIIEKGKESSALQAQLADPNTDIFNGLPFKESSGSLSAEQKEADFRAYVDGLDEAKKAETYLTIMSIPAQEMVDQTVEQTMSAMTRESMTQTLIQAVSAQTGMSVEDMQGYIDSMSDEDLSEMFSQIVEEQFRTQYAANVKEQMAALSVQQLAGALAMAMPTYTTEQCAAYYDDVLVFSSSSYDLNLYALGNVDLDTPASINLYASSFENKDVLEEIITEYNNGVDELERISYTDYVGLMMSSVTSIINAITYVLIAFVAVSLIVSSIMIGVITLISVQERTKEIGILRAIGASKKNVSSMFNAETVMIGFTSGLLGVLITYLLCIPINAILHYLTGIGNLSAILPIPTAVILVIISVVLTLFAGIIPSRSAAKKDPVVALRTE